MTNRRGLARAHSHWRPAPAAPRPTTSASRTPVRRRRRLVRWLAAVCVCVAAGVAIGLVLDSGQAGGGLPRTVPGWLDSFTAAAARDPGRLCSELVTPAFRRALRSDLHESCVSYYSRVRGAPIRILRILQSGTTAALEVRNWPHGAYTTFVLDRQDGGWRAVAIVPGGPLPTA